MRHDTPSTLVGHSAALAELKEEIVRVADSDAKVAQTYVIAKFAKLPEHREHFILNNIEGDWKIDAMPQFFKPAPKKKR